MKKLVTTWVIFLASAAGFWAYLRLRKGISRNRIAELGISENALR